MQATIAPHAAFRKKHGIKPKGDGPHAPSAYGLPVPPKGHPLAKPFARAVLSRAAQALNGGRFERADVVKQVRKANTILYGKPAPTRAEKLAARQKRKERDLAYHAESGAIDTREAYIPGTVEGSWEAISDDILKAAQASTLFGGPALSYGDPGYSLDDAVRTWDISIAVAYPTKSQVVISNSKSGDMWLTTFALGTDMDGDATVSFSDVTPAQIKVVAKAKEALAKARESGVIAPRFARCNIITPMREAKFNDDGTVRIMAISVGRGNLRDNNYYNESFIDSVVSLIGGEHSHLDHPTPIEEQQIPERSVHSLAGWFSSPEKGTFTDPEHPELGARPAAFAIFHPKVGDTEVVSLLRTCQEKYEKYPEKAPFVAFSILGYGVGAAGKSPDDSSDVNLMESMTQMESTDMVTQAGARGRPVYEENPKVKTASGGATTESNAGSLSNFADADVQIDIRTTEERAADKLALRGKVLVTTIESLFAGPTGQKLREAAGVVDPKIKVSALKPAELTSLAEKLGLSTNSALDTLLDETLTESTAVAATETATEETDVEEVDDETLNDMTAEQLRAHIRKNKKKPKESGTGESKKEKIRSLEAQIAQIGRANVINETMAQLKITGEHRPIIERLVKDDRDKDAIVTAIRAYKDTQLSGRDSAGVLGSTRESATSAAGSFKPSYLR